MTEEKEQTIPISPRDLAQKIGKLTHGERLKAILQLFKKEDRVLIVIIADPDSMACALALKRLLSRRVEEICIAHPNEITRVNNLAMRNRLHISLQRLNVIKKERYTKFVLLDSQPLHSPELSDFHYDAVIDHHPMTEGWHAGFVDIRPEYGATASMMTEYLKAAKIKPSVILATALFYGIKVDTQNFAKKAIYPDILAFQYLFQLINQNLLNRIENADIRHSELKYIKSAFQGLIVSQDRVYAHVDNAPNTDILVVIADFLSHIHDISWVIVSGIYEDKLVVIFRSDGYRKNAGKMAKKIFGEMGSAGGHRQSARAEIPIKNLSKIRIDKFKTSSLKRLILKHM